MAKRKQKKSDDPKLPSEVFGSGLLRGVVDIFRSKVRKERELEEELVGKGFRRIDPDKI